MRILFITRAWSNNAGGMERLSYELTRAYKQHSGDDVQVVVHGGSRMTAPLFVFTCIPSVLRAARRADVVHIGDPLLSLPGWLISKLMHKPVAVTVHGLDVTYSNPLYRLYLSLFFRSFAAYLPISEHAKALLRTWNPKGIVQVITPGFIDQYYNPSFLRKDLDEICARDTAQRVVLFTSGRLVQRKGHEWFIRHVLPYLPKHVLYVIAGDGPEAENIRIAAKDAGVSDQVLLLGKVSAKTLITLYNTVDVFIQPNISVQNDAEGFGLVLVEAASAARPVFAADIDGIPGAIHNGKNGTLLKAEDANAWIMGLTSFINGSSNLPKEAREYTILTFSWEKKIQEFKNVFRAL